jgi:hypothetical protein
MSKAAELANLIGNINAGGGTSGRNLVINGAMNILQRDHLSFADSAHATHTLDMFRIGKSHDGAVTVTQDSSGPNGFAKSLKVDVTTADTSIGATQYAHIFHRIEAQNLQHLKFGTSDAQNFTLSFYVKSNKTGTYALTIGQNDNSYKQASQTYTIDSANTWERKSLTFTGDTAGVINNDNGHGLEIVWWLALGSTYTSGSSSASFATYADANHGAGHAVNLLDNTSNEWFLTGVQLELGQNETEFEHESFERTLRKCQRYYQSIRTNNGYTAYNGHIFGSTSGVVVVPLITEMRTSPTGVTVTNVGSFGIVTYGNLNRDCNNIAFSAASTKQIKLDCYDATGGFTIGHGCMLFDNGSNGVIEFTGAEL